MKTPRYTKQPNDFGCGPTAIVNVLKWVGERASLNSHYEYLEKLCQTKDSDENPDFHGTKASDFNRAINLVSRDRFKVKYRMIPTHSSLVKHLAKGGSVVLMHRNNMGQLHYTYITKITQALYRGKDPHYHAFQYEVVNAFEDTPASHTVWDYELRAWLCRENKCPQAWYITKSSKTV